MVTNLQTYLTSKIGQEICVDLSPDKYPLPDRVSGIVLTVGKDFFILDHTELEGNHTQHLFTYSQLRRIWV